MPVAMGRPAASRAAVGKLEEYRCTRLWRMLAMRLAVPATDDATRIRTGREALERARREAAGLALREAVEVLVGAYIDAAPDRKHAAAEIAALRSRLEAEEPPGHDRRRAIGASVEKGIHS